MLLTELNHVFKPFLCNVFEHANAFARSSEEVVSSLCQYDKAERRIFTWIGNLPSSEDTAKLELL